MTIKLGVLALAGPDNGGTYQYTLSMLQALRHTSGFDITVYGDPQNPDFIDLGYPISRFAESRAQQVAALAAASNAYQAARPICFSRISCWRRFIRWHCCTHQDHLPSRCTIFRRIIIPQNFSWWQRAWRYQVHSQLLRRARRVICESRQVKTDIIRSFGVPEEQTAVIAAPPLQQFLADAKRRSDYRQRGSDCSYPRNSCSIPRNSGSTKIICG